MKTYVEEKMQPHPIIRINRPKCGGKPFLQIEFETFLRACDNLTTNALKLYAFLMQNANGYNCHLIFAEAGAALGLEEQKVKIAFIELMAKHYLACREGCYFEVFDDNRSHAISHSDIPFPIDFEDVDASPAI